jgi:protoporphyrinogen oxidase
MSVEALAPSCRWGVIGGGMLGLALARRLAAHGQQVTVLEGAAEIGGLAGAWQLGDVVWDRHYHVTLLSDARLRALLRDLGLDHEMRWVETRTGFYTDGRLHSMSNTLEFLRFPPLSLIDKFRLGATIFAASRIKNWRPLESVLVADWLRQWSGERTFRKIWQPLLEAKLGACYRKTSAAFIWATIQRMYAARHSGLKKEMFGYVPGGYARVLERFGEHLQAAGVELRTGCRVSSVTTQPDGQVLIDSNRGSRWFDRVVLTAPSPLIAQLCPQLSEEERQRHESIEYLGIVCASVLLDRPLASYYVTNITDAGLPFTAVIEMTTLVDPAELNGNHLAYLPRYAAADDEAWSWSDHEIEERFLTGLERMYPAFSREHVKAFRVSRAKHVMALPTLRYSEHLPPFKTAAPNIFAVNSAHIVKGTLNVNEVLELADDAFDRVLAPALGPGSAEGKEWATSLGDFNTAPITTDKHDESPGELVARP